jgi:hypothetical protein
MMLTLANLARLGPKAKNTATSGSDLVAKVNPESATEKKRADVPQSQSQPLAIPIQTTASLIGQPNPFLDKDA